MKIHLFFLGLIFYGCTIQEISSVDTINKMLISAWKVDRFSQFFYSSKENKQLIHITTENTVKYFSFDKLGRFYDTLVAVQSDTILKKPIGSWQLHKDKRLQIIIDSLNNSIFYIISFNNNVLSLKTEQEFSQPKLLKFKNKDYYYKFIELKFFAKKN